MTATRQKRGIGRESRIGEEPTVNEQQPATHRGKGGYRKHGTERPGSVANGGDCLKRRHRQKPVLLYHD